MISHQSSVISHQSSVISHQSSVISYRSSVISHQLSVISHQLSVISYQLSVIINQGTEFLLSVIQISNQSLRTVIATLQDLGFVVDKADATLGTVTATKLQGYNLVMTVAVRPKGDTQLIVRASAQYNATVTDPKLYQDFFAALSKAMFLEAHQVD